ncbi:hypothetical protein [Nitrosomonas sp. Nm33]|uniref:glycoside hydrolase family 38 N-terminal domain-containing protein n=1 Tax=Nitrosomonas sp. Nm33 TaxID=133724 RepID=UPI0015A05878|nr:hypothetical protein [Nitrosomonas sp. Nm33]
MNNHLPMTVSPTIIGEARSLTKRKEEDVMKTIHVISHTHWDREWYRTFQQFRLQLVHLVDGLLDMLAKDPNYKYFMLDGQTIVLDDYLLMRSEAEDTLKEHVRNRRILIGPCHILPDMFLASPEAHIHNLLVGEREARKFGQKMMIGYMPDSFGHIGQMPQILRGFGMENACLWRGLDDQPAGFWWQFPDGSRVLTMYLHDHPLWTAPGIYRSCVMCVLCAVLSGKQ